MYFIVGPISASSRSSGRTDYGRPSQGLDLFAVVNRNSVEKVMMKERIFLNFKLILLQPISHSSGLRGIKSDLVLLPCAGRRSMPGNDGFI